MVYAWMTQGGALMWPIFGLSVLGLMIILERAFYWIRHAWISDPARRRGPVARIVALDPQAARREADRLLRSSRRGVGALEMIASLSTSLGLFGTVAGISMSFQSMGAGDTAKIVSGLGVALFTTVLGLVVHLYCAVLASLYGHLADRLEGRLELELRRGSP